jgi:hypothetical protein
MSKAEPTLDELVERPDRLDRVPIWLRLPPRELSAKQIASALPTDTHRDAFIGFEDTDEYEDYDHRVEDIDTFVLYTGDAPRRYTVLSQELNSDRWERVTSVRSENAHEGTKYENVHNEIKDRFLSPEVMTARVATYHAGIDAHFYTTNVGENGEVVDDDEVDHPEAERVYLADLAEYEAGLVSEYDEDLGDVLLDQDIKAKYLAQSEKKKVDFSVDIFDYDEDDGGEEPFENAEAIQGDINVENNLDGRVDDDIRDALRYAAELEKRGNITTMSGVPVVTSDDEDDTPDTA